jgi:hypothetical protein
MVMTASTKTKAKATAAAVPPKPNDLKLIGREGVSDSYLKSEIVLHPTTRHANTGTVFGGQLFGGKDELSIIDGVNVLEEACKRTRDGDLSYQRDALTVQAITLDTIFTEMARRGAMNMGTNLDATDRYIRMALKAQAQSRATIESLDRLVRGGEQVVRHIHVDNRGGQAMIAETINTGGNENGKAVGQPYAIESGAPSLGQPLRSAHPEREAVPVAGDAERTV